MSFFKEKQLFQNAGRFFFGTLLSRFTGLFRELTMALIFGVTSQVAAFFVAYRLANLCRRLLGEGAISPGIIPHYKQLEERDPKAADQFIVDLLGVLFRYLLPSLLALEALLFFLYQSYFSSEILLLVIVLLPSMLLYTVQGIAKSLLECHDYFFRAAFSPVVLNGIWILSALSLRSADPERGVFILAIAVLFATAIQTVVMIWPVVKRLRYLRPQKASSSIEVMLKPLGYGFIGVAAVQVNTALDALFARCASPDGPALLWYSLRVQQLPLSLFGIALSSAILPPLSKAVVSRDSRKVDALLKFAVKWGVLTLIPASAALMLFPNFIMRIIYQRGAFDAIATKGGGECLFAYGIGLVPMSLAIIYAQVFFAQKDYKTSMKASIISVVANIFINSFLVFGLGFGAKSVAASTSACAFINLSILIIANRVSSESKPSLD